MKIKDLLFADGIFITKCGCCCDKELPCDKCIDRNLESNGVDVSLRNKFKGLKHINHSYPFGENSELEVAIGKFKQGII